jgi:hypothetical protein
MRIATESQAGVTVGYRGGKIEADKMWGKCKKALSHHNVALLFAIDLITAQAINTPVAVIFTIKYKVYSSKAGMRSF